MAKIDPNSLRDWNNGDIMKEFDYEKERAILIAAINDLEDKKTSGKNVSVASAATSLAVTFANAEPNISYAVAIAPGWNTTWWITSKATTGFTINFGTAPGSTSALDWTTTR